MLPKPIAGIGSGVGVDVGVAVGPPGVAVAVGVGVGPVPDLVNIAPADPTATNCSVRAVPPKVTSKSVGKEPETALQLVPLSGEVSTVLFAPTATTPLMSKATPHKVSGVPDTLEDQVTPLSVETRISPLSPTAINVEDPTKPTPFKFPVVPDVWEVKFFPSVEVSIVPLAPTATNVLFPKVTSERSSAVGKDNPGVVKVIPSVELWTWPPNPTATNVPLPKVTPLFGLKATIVNPLFDLKSADRIFVYVVPSGEVMIRFPARPPTATNRELPKATSERSSEKLWLDQLVPVSSEEVVITPLRTSPTATILELPKATPNRLFVVIEVWLVQVPA